MEKVVLKSEEDESVNFILPYGKGVMEARYVRRQDDYFICYLSSQTGCNRGCKFCHLTTTGQTQFEQINRHGMQAQARAVFEHYKTQPPAKIVNFNWMARGEALCNPSLLVEWHTVAQLMQLMNPEIVSYAEDRDISCRFNISTIMPRALEKPLYECFRYGPYPTLYYSLYSMDEEWRAKWLPGAMPAWEALDKLVEYQQLTQKIVYIHGAFIKGENDGSANLYSMMQAVRKRDLRIKWNIVRYNPYSPVEGEETEKIGAIQRELTLFFGERNVQVVSRVGRDCYASCGMFPNAELYE